MAVEIVTIPCLSDNYAFLVHDDETGATAIVDVPETGPIARVLGQRGWALSDILITHHHEDHIGGVDALRVATGARVVGGRADASRLPALDLAVSDGDRFRIGSIDVDVFDVSGHTLGHLAFYMPKAAAAFTADSLMAMGCGRLFEGTPAQMWASLSKLATLPPETLICSGHEYTAANARFALTIEPANAVLVDRARRIEQARAKGEATVPSLLSEELATNPFLRAKAPAVKAALGMADATDAAVFAEIRGRKDRF
ncbi:MAG: hydroxyacylglutathione hydrolase [Paracoccaceae bacterium]